MTTAEYRARNPEKCRAAVRKWQLEHPGWYKKYEGRYPNYPPSEGARARQNARKRARRVGMSTGERAAVRAQKRGHYARNRDRLRADSRRRMQGSYARNPERHLAATRDYEHRKRANGGRFPHGAWEHMKVLFGNRCAYCGRRMKRLTQDHVTPVSKGGWHFSGNIVPACQSCNSSKGAKGLSPAHTHAQKSQPSARLTSC